MKETRRNVSWHAGEDKYGESKKVLYLIAVECSLR